MLGRNMEDATMLGRIKGHGTLLERFMIGSIRKDQGKLSTSTEDQRK